MPMAQPADDAKHHSFLDVDLYKVFNAMLAFVHFPEIDVVWKYSSREPHLSLTEKGFDWFSNRMTELDSLVISNEELEFLRQQCPYLSEAFLTYLEGFRFRTSEHLQMSWAPLDHQISAKEDPLGLPCITASGKWCDTCLYENHILQTLVEAYFRFSDTDWTLDGQEQEAFEKSRKLLKSDISFVDFGTRRRRSLKGQIRVLRGLKRGSETGSNHTKGTFLGTSNVHLARILSLNPLGTMSHEWFMGVGALVDDFDKASSTALTLWLESYGQWLRHDHIFGLALTDTFGSEFFMDSFRNCPDKRLGNMPNDWAQLPFFKLFTGLRCDSMHDADFLTFVSTFYEKLMPESWGSTGLSGKKTLMFSNSMTVQKCIDLSRHSAADKFDLVFAMSSHLTNDFAKPSLNPNVTFKLVTVDGKPAVKLSDVPSKALGDPDEVRRILSRQPRENRY